MSKARSLADLGNVYDDGALSQRNMLINGSFAVAQRGTSFTADNVYTLDRWKSGDGTGGTPARTLSQETFTLGQTDVPNAHYYLKHNQTAASTNGNSSLVQKVEDVTRFDGQTVTLSFYAKADAAMDVDIRFIQDFGTGGSPSSDVTITETVSIGTSWTKYTVTKTMGSLSGKTLGTDGVHTSFLSLNMEFQPTSTFTFEGALFQLEYGDTSTPFEHIPYPDQLARCQRYFHRIGGSTGSGLYDAVGAGVAVGGTTGYVNVPLKVQMRAKPSVTFTGTLSMHTGVTAPDLDNSNFSNYLDKNGGLLAPIRDGGSALTNGNGLILYCQNSADTADFDAEL